MIQKNSVRVRFNSNGVQIYTGSKFVPCTPGEAAKAVYNVTRNYPKGETVRSKSARA